MPAPPLLLFHTLLHTIIIITLHVVFLLPSLDPSYLFRFSFFFFFLCCWRDDIHGINVLSEKRRERECSVAGRHVQAGRVEGSHLSVCVCVSL